jgi:hypothetical protein
MEYCIQLVANQFADNYLLLWYILTLLSPGIFFTVTWNGVRAHFLLVPLTFLVGVEVQLTSLTWLLADAT